MTPQTFIFIGRSGCGKGTQAKLIEEYLKKLDSKRSSLYIYTGAQFREFIKGDNHTQKLSKEIYDIGGFQPEFLAIYMWADTLVKKYDGKQHLILDGMPRKYHEAGALDSVFPFYKLNTPHVVYLDISKEEAVRRLLARKRIDDTEEEIKERLSWFEQEVTPTLDFFRNNPDYTYMVVNGEQPIEKVHQDVIDHLVLN